MDMARGGARPGAGRPKTARSSKESAAPGSRKSAASGNVPADVGQAARGEKLTPLEYMLKVMNSADADDGRRDRMAVAAAPFVHGRAGEVGKKDEKLDAAKAAGQGKFGSPPPPPRLVASK